jgi:hypothetical protein
MDITTQSEVLLRGAGYDTWVWTGGVQAVVCFENAAVIGFVHVFATAHDLMRRWPEVQTAALSRHGPALRLAGVKAWNVYSVFLTEEQASSQQRDIERIEEDFALTRKIARAGLRTSDDLERVLLPLTAVRSQPVPSDMDFENRLRFRLREVPPDALTAFLGNAPAEDVAKMLAEKE